MRLYLLCSALIFSCYAFAQTDTEVYLFDLTTENETFNLTNKRNISANPGYDNQPSFYDDETVLFAATRTDQTDIAAYHIKEQRISWISNTSGGSEYSPTRIPGKKEISSIRLDKDGKQLLYRYNFKDGNSKVLVENLVIGYHTWFNKKILVSFVLGKESSLVVSNIKKKSHDTVSKNIGRSLHKIPDTKLISYISKENPVWEIRSLDPVSGEIKKIIRTIPGTEDMCWLPSGTVLMGKGKHLYTYKPGKDADWQQVKAFSDKEIYSITRLAVNTKGNVLAVVAEASPELVVQQQLDAYNNRDINTFTATFSEGVKVYNFPDELIYEGREKLRKNYQNFFNATPDLHCEIKSRTVTGNKVIDVEYLTINGRNYSAVAVYEVQNGKISKVTFIQ